MSQQSADNTGPQSEYLHLCTRIDGTMHRAHKPIKWETVARYHRSVEQNQKPSSRVQAQVRKHLGRVMACYATELICPCWLKYGGTKPANLCAEVVNLPLSIMVKVATEFAMSDDDHQHIQDAADRDEKKMDVARLLATAIEGVNISYRQKVDLLRLLIARIEDAADTDQQKMDFARLLVAATEEKYLGSIAALLARLRLPRNKINGVSP